MNKSKLIIISFLVAMLVFFLHSTMLAQKEAERGVRRVSYNPEAHTMTIKCIATNDHYSNCQPAGYSITIND